MIMRLTGIAVVSAIVGACAAMAPIPHAAQPVPREPQEIHGHTPKRLISPPGKIDPEVGTRLDSIEKELRALKSDILSPGERPADQR